MRLLLLTTDAFGGLGGIAQYNRDLLHALCSHPGVTSVTALPRVISGPLEPLPHKLDYRAASAGSGWRYLAELFRVLSTQRFDIVLCGHVNLLPLAQYARAVNHTPMLLVLYGVEVWKPTGRALANALMARVDGLMSISQITMDRCLAWSGLGDVPQCIIPNAIDLSRFGPGPKSAALLDRYKLRGKRILLTLARLSAEERYKGVDEMLARLPTLLRRWPDLAYLIAGDGTDRARLQQVAASNGVSDHVVFAGRVGESEKLDHYRLADAFVMPGRGEGFGFVFLEALASGIPVVASSLDGSREAVRNGLLGALVNPDNGEDIDRGVAEALAQPRGVVPEGLSYFSYPNFQARVHAWVDTFPSLRRRA